MADIWQQFHSLPKAIRDGVSTPKAIQAVDDLEAQHPGADLANIIMRAVVHEFPVADLEQQIQKECAVDALTATSIADRLKNDVFTGDIAEYLGISASIPATPPPAKPLPVGGEAVSAPIPVQLPVTPMTDAPAPTMPKVPKEMARSSVPIPKTTAEIEAKVVPLVPTLPTTAPTLPSAPMPAAPVGPVSPTTQYSDDDAKEIEAQVSRLKQLSNINPNQDFDSIARRVLTEQNVAYGDELLERRAVAIVKARLKGVRTTEETKDILIRDAKIGGIGLDLEIAGSVAAAAEKYAVELKSRGMVQEQEVLPPTPPVPLPKVNQEKPEPKPPFRRDGEVANPTIPVNIVDAPRASRPIIRPVDIPAPPAPVVVQKPVMKPVQAAPAAQPMIQRARGADRPTTADVVRPASRSLGPAEEMRSITLIEFRRLGQGAADAAQRLLDKFKHLQKESFTVWAEAVAGWRESDVYQLYLTMGRESLEKAVPISQVIAERTRLGQPYLSDHEFGILADLNRQLQL